VTAQPGERGARGARRLLLLGLLVVAAALCGPAVPPLVAASADSAPAAPVTVTAAPAVEPAEDPVAHRPGVGVVPRATAVPEATVAAAPSAGPPPATPSADVLAVAAPAPSPLPLPVEPPGSQVVTVVADSRSATTARLTAWELGADGWTAVLGPVTARIGSAGQGTASETSTRTPAGTFSLTEAFGRAADPGTALPYRVVDGDDWWVSDVTSPRYNQYAECAPGSCDFDETAGEDLYAAGAVYDHAVVIDYNRGGTPGAGSAFFLHVSNGAPTAGCVAIDRGSLQTLLRWLDPAASPVISIGVG
jgi:L,D-peptidoglycan transpeptidase YkuD (ErfK/YbiS/YcfS/YnhG family)